MPGIVGLIQIGSKEEKSKILQSMVGCMLHEPFYAVGTYANDRLHAGIGWISHQGSCTECLPIWNETKDICLIFSGEDFADAREVAVLRAKGHEFNLETANYLVHSYEEKGLAFLEELNGWFSGVLVDLRQQKVML